MSAKINIGSRVVGHDFPPLVIAEIGINHEGKLDVAIEMADAAIKAGVEIIKHQTHVIEDEMSIEAKNIIPGNADVSIYEIMSRCALSESDEKKLMDYICSKKVLFISTPFSRMAVDRLMRFNVPAFKIGSGECNNYPLLRYVSQFRKPIILSTGMNAIKSIARAVEIFRMNGTPYALLHCTNVYPTPNNLVRLGAISELESAFPDAVIGLSDHTVSNNACLGAVALGASILERHFTDAKSRQGPDIICSMDPIELKSLIIGSNEIFQSRGGVKGPIQAEDPTIAFAFASVVATKEISSGEKLTNENIWVMRPGGGDFSAADYDSLIGRAVNKAVAKGFQLKASDLK